MPNISNIAAYKFADLSDLRSLRARLLALCKSWGLKGTILLSTEGINLFAAGEPDKIDLLLTELRSHPGLENLQVKESRTDHQPFTRMLVRIKKEIIAFGVEGIQPAHHTSPKLAPTELKQWLDEGRPVTLLDTRNDYEVKLGTFKDARPIGIEHFRSFPDAVRKLPPEMKTAPIVMFCTGGIRCEKAGPFMEREGFQNVFQLDGGILKYFEQCGGAHYQGECFVFDQRVGVDPALQETESDQCFVCQSPLTAQDQKDERYAPGRSCPYCYKSDEEQLSAVIARRQDAIHRAIDPLPGSSPYDNFRPISVPQSTEGGTIIDAFCRVVTHLPRHHWEAEAARGMLLDRERNPVSSSHIVHAGDRYLHKFPGVTEPAVDGNIQILHEDEALIVIHKPAPLPMHAGGRFNRNTLQYILNEVYYPEKPHPAHRLDANTTGVLLLTRTRHFASLLQPQFANGTVKKVYLARVHGHPAHDSFYCDAPIASEPGDMGTRQVDVAAGLPARTEFKVVERRTDQTSIVEARPLTGRTNQIRIHLSHLGHPICGDPVYRAERKSESTQTLAVGDPPMELHAWKISFIHPLTRKPMEFTAMQKATLTIRHS